MSEFDPYLNWLGIRNSGRSAHYYRLLNLELFEADPKVINNAALRQIAHLRSFVNSEHGAHVPQIESRMAQAANVLMNDKKKAEYDRRLRAHLQQKSQKIQKPQAAEKNQTSEVVAPKQRAVPAAAPVRAPVPTVPPTPTAPPVPTTAAAPVAPVVAPLVGVEVGAASETDDSPIRRSKGTGIFGSLIGVVLGGVASVFVAGWIINQTSLVETLRGKLHGTTVAEGGATDSEDESIKLGDNPFDSVVTEFDSDPDAPLTTPYPGQEIASSTTTSNGSNSNKIAAVSEEDPVDEEEAKRKTVIDKKPPKFFPSKKKAQITEKIKPRSRPIPDDGPKIDVTEDEPVQPAAKTARLDIPDEDLIEEAKESIKEAYPYFYGKGINSMHNEIQLAKLVESSARENQVANRYVAMSEVVDIAAKMGEPKTFYECLTKLDQNFKIDFNEVAKMGVRSLTRNVDSPRVALELSDALRSLTERGLDQQEFEAASHMSTVYATVARGIDPALAEAAKLVKREVSEMQKLVKRGTEAGKAVAENDGDQGAQELFGDKLLFIDKDFVTAVDHWAKCDDELKLKLATREIEMRDEAHTKDSIKEIGDMWYDAAAGSKGFQGTQMLDRANYWYRKMQASENGLTKAYATNRINKIKERLTDSLFGVTIKQPTATQDLFRFYIQKEFAFKTTNRNAFTVRLYSGYLYFTPFKNGRESYNDRVRLTFKRTNDMIVASLEDQPNSLLYFKFERAGVNPVMKFEEVDKTSGEVREQGVGVLRK